jgi:hypothetical protein
MCLGFGTQMSLRLNGGVRLEVELQAWRTDLAKRKLM